MRGGFAAGLVLLAAVASRPASADEAAPAPSVAEVALRQLDALEQLDDPQALEEQRALARTALEMAGESVTEPLVRRLAAGGARCAVTAWALAESAPEAPGTPASVAEALRRRVRDGGADWECRIGAASALGRLGVAAASSDVVAAWRDPFRPPGTEGVVLLAVAGCGGPEADAVVGEWLRRSGDEAWARLAVAACVRRGPAASALAVGPACDDADPRVRATATLALLLLADPASACALAECAASERDPGLRRLKYQALAATQSPGARAFLRHAATLERDRELAAAALVLAEMPLSARGGGNARVTSTQVREALQAMTRTNPSPRLVDEVETGATGLDVPAVERALRLLPLRDDARWLDDAARLGQLRARLLCAGDPDCEPVRTRVTRGR